MRRDYGEGYRLHSELKESTASLRHVRGEVHLYSDQDSELLETVNKTVAAKGAKSKRSNGVSLKLQKTAKSYLSYSSIKHALTDMRAFELYMAGKLKKSLLP